MKTLFDVQPGDHLVVNNRIGRRVVTVEHVTSTRFKTKDGLTWNKKSAKQVGASHDPWFPERIRIPEENELEEMRLNHRCRNELKDCDALLEKILANIKSSGSSQQLLDALIHTKIELSRFVEPDTEQASDYDNS